MTDDRKTPHAPDDDPENELEDRDQENRPGSVSEKEANPIPPETDVTTSEDVHDTPQTPPRTED